MDSISLKQLKIFIRIAIKRNLKRLVNFLAIASFCILFMYEAVAQPLSLWCVVNGHATVYLLGSIHALKPGAYPLAKEIENAFAASDKFVFEVDLQKRSSIESAVLMEQKGTYVFPQTIESELSAETYQKLHYYLEANELSIDEFKRFRPWMIGLRIGLMEITKAGYKMELGVDIHYQGRARRLGKPVLQLESIEQQIELLAGESAAIQDISLRAALDDVSQLGELLPDLLSAWHRGAADEMYELSVQQNKKYPELDQYMDRLLDQRNFKMVEQIKNFLVSDGTYFVVIGALHMGGSNGILALLARDHQITQIHHSRK